MKLHQIFVNRQRCITLDLDIKEKKRNEKKNTEFLLPKLKIIITENSI